MSQGDLPVEQPFDLGSTLTMGQCLRWRKENGGWYSGLVGDKLIMLRQTAADRVEFRTGNPHESDGDMLHRYLGLDRNIPRIGEILSQCDPNMAEMLGRYEGMRALRPEPWECLITCMCSPGQPARRLLAGIERLSEYYGERMSLDGVTRHSFPRAEGLAGAGVAELSRVALRMPRRAEFVHRVAEDVSAGNLRLDALGDQPYAEARERLMQYEGIGPTMADCVLLISLDKYEEHGKE